MLVSRRISQWSSSRLLNGQSRGPSGQRLGPVVAVSIAFALAGLQPLGAQIASTVSIRDCLEVSVDTDSPSQLSAAIRLCTIVLEGQNLTAAQRADVLIQRSVAFRNLNEAEKSIADLTTAKHHAPKDPHLSRMLGWSLREIGRLEDAEAELSRSIALEAHPQGFLARCYTRYGLGNLKEAQIDCETVHAVDPSEDSAFMTARLYVELGRIETALPMLEAIVGKGLDSGRLYGLLAEVYTKAGRAGDARRITEEGRRKFPRDPTLSLPAD